MLFCLFHIFEPEFRLILSDCFIYERMPLNLIAKNTKEWSNQDKFRSFTEFDKIDNYGFFENNLIILSFFKKSAISWNTLIKIDKILSLKV